MTESTSGRVTRRKVLKRAGVGAAALWTAPLIVSTPTASAAPTVKRCIALSAVDGIPCVNSCRQEGPICSNDDVCICTLLVNGCCACIDFNTVDCSQNQPCSRNADCARNFKCVKLDGCCRTNVCLPVCTSPPPTAPRGTRRVDIR